MVSGGDGWGLQDGWKSKAVGASGEKMSRVVACFTRRVYLAFPQRIDNDDNNQILGLTEAEI